MPEASATNCPARSPLGKGRAPQLGSPPRLVGHDPDLEDLRGLVLQIIFRMGHARAGGHDLDVARFGAAGVAETVLVGDRAASHIGDDLHVAMRMRREARPGRDRVIVPDAHLAPVDPRGIVIIGEREMMVRVEPAVVSGAEAAEGSQFDHRASPFRRSVAPIWTLRPGSDKPDKTAPNVRRS